MTAHGIVKKVEDIYPDKMVLEEMSDFERGKKAGKVELIQEMKQLLEDEKDGKQTSK